MSNLIELLTILSKTDWSYGITMNRPIAFADLFQQIRESEGTGFLDRAHQRSFSLNIFKMNALELLWLSQRVRDPKQCIALMAEKNREAGIQAHRELNRHIHNFVSSSLTLVEHTRVFMRTHYAGTEILTIYENKARDTFANSPVAQFVQGLRNYMLHRGLPNSSMFMKFEAAPSEMGGVGTMETGVSYDTASLLDWKDWKSVARTYIEQAGEHLDIHEVTQEYLALVSRFHDWLDSTLEKYHHSDLQEVSQLKIKLNKISPDNEPTLQTNLSDSLPIEPFMFTSAHAAELELISFDIFGKVKEIRIPHEVDDFATERPITLITGQDIIGDVISWVQDVNGAMSIIFFKYNEKTYGLVESDYKFLNELIDVVMKAAWARTKISRKFVETTFFNWVRQQFLSVQIPFSEALSDAVQKSVMNIEVLAPIANMEVEQGFDFGPVRIDSITANTIENLRSGAPLPSPEQEPDVRQFFEKLKNDIQGYAAVIVSVEAEKKFAAERAFQIAQDAVGLLSFFSPAASCSYIFNSVALAGTEYLPRSKLIVKYEGGFSHTECILPKNIGYWRLSKRKFAEINSELLKAAASLVVSEGLSEFALAVRASILTYSKGTTLIVLQDRLRYCLFALESILLKHDMEPRAYSVINRMCSILVSGGAVGEDVKAVIQQIYWLLDQPQLTELGDRENSLIATFISYTYYILQVVLGNVEHFSYKIQFLDEVDRIDKC